MFTYSCNAQQKEIKISPETQIINNDSLYCQEEVCAIETKQGELLVAWLDRKTGTQEKTVSYMVSTDNQKNWATIQKHDNKDFIWTGNPAVAKDDVGNLYIVDMSANYEEGKIPNKGIFEITVSKDNGKTWAEWKTIIKNTGVNKGFPDKPTLIAKGNGELYISYISFDIDTVDLQKSHGKVVFQKSKDGGETWTTPIEIKLERVWKPSSMANMLMSGGADLGEQGPSLGFFDNKILISWGGYHEKGIYFTNSDNDGNSFNTASKICNSKVEVPVTQLLLTKNKWVILYYNAHTVGDIYCVQSSDSGKTWTANKIAGDASILSGAMDNNENIHVVWNEKTKKTRTTFYSIISNDLNYKPVALTPKSEVVTNLFIGAYQQFLIDTKQNKHIFWIDWQIKGGKLKHSYWK